jgi:hypothetical protein
MSTFISEIIFVVNSTYFTLKYTCSKGLPDYIAVSDSLFTIPKSVALLI